MKRRPTEQSAVTGGAAEAGRPAPPKPATYDRGKRFIGAAALGVKEHKGSQSLGCVLPLTQPPARRLKQSGAVGGVLRS